ncbi:MAG: hypothetical protein EHM70_06455 [Chloroflexota bacterium]|nr:MAG: hypothetical protein EHM70_06455 [Chloroflexota bacterium]
MPENKPRDLIPVQGGVFSDLATRVKLVLRLLGDPRVNMLVKAIPVGSVIYLLFPDLAPGPIDDAAILWLGMYLFVELCPPEVVEEHMRALTRTAPGEFSQEPEKRKRDEEEILEGEFREE